MGDTGDNEGGFMLFGRDVSKIPCFRNSFMSGIGGGIISGLAYFMYSSNARRASNVGFASYVLVTVGTWSYCRYKWDQEVHKNDMFKKALQAKILTDGTELQKAIESETKDV